MSFSFRSHPEIKDRHAFLSPSGYHWLRYSEEKLIEKFDRHMDAALGTRLHNVAAECIALGLKQQASKKTFNQYVNDCIGWRMTPEVPLVYSENCFGHADAVGFTKARGETTHSHILRISDLKNGITKASMDQLLVYTALFFLEYGMRISDVLVELRIYQNDDVELYIPGVDEILETMETIKRLDSILVRLRQES